MLKIPFKLDQNRNYSYEYLINICVLLFPIFTKFFVIVWPITLVIFEIQRYKAEQRKHPSLPKWFTFSMQVRPRCQFELLAMGWKLTKRQLSWRQIQTPHQTAQIRLHLWRFRVQHVAQNVVRQLQVLPHNPLEFCIWARWVESPAQRWKPWGLLFRGLLLAVAAAPLLLREKGKLGNKVRVGALPCCLWLRTGKDKWKSCKTLNAGFSRTKKAFPISSGCRQRYDSTQTDNCLIWFYTFVFFRCFLSCMRSAKVIFNPFFDPGEPWTKEAAGSVGRGWPAVSLWASLAGEEPAYSGERGTGQESGTHDRAARADEYPVWCLEEQVFGQQVGKRWRKHMVAFQCPATWHHQI